MASKHVGEGLEGDIKITIHPISILKEAYGI
jgi:hypothetical protein